VKRFLAKNVPDFLRRRALRTLWKSHPTFAVLDGLNDYDEDFNLPEFNQKIIGTSYQVGKGIVRKVEELLEDDELDVAEVEAEDDENEISAPEVIEEQLVLTVAETDVVDPVEESVPTYAPRRMRFDT